MENKKRAAYVSSGDSIIDYGTGKAITVVPGDVLQIKVNVYGDIEWVRRMYSREADSYGESINYTPNADYTSDARVVVGEVYSTDGPFFTMVEDSKINYSNKEKFAEVMKTTTPYAYVYVYDSEERKVTLGTYMDIIKGKRLLYIYFFGGTGTLLYLLPKSENYHFSLQ